MKKILKNEGVRYVNPGCLQALKINPFILLFAAFMGVINMLNAQESVTIIQQSDFSNGAPSSWFTFTTSQGSLSFSDSYAKGIYPVTEGNGESHVNISIPIPEDIYDIYIQFKARMPGNKGGCKFLKVHGREPTSGNYANTTFGTWYTNGEFQEVAFGDGLSDGNDTQNVIGYDGNHFLGRNDGIATISTPQNRVFDSNDWGTNWHDFKIHCKFNSGTTSSNETNDGEYYVEIDGVVWCDAKNLFNRHFSNQGIEKVTLFNWSQSSPVSFEVNYDDVIISTGGFVDEDPSSTYTLTVNSGSGDGDYEESTVVNIIADTPPANKEFDKWIGDVDSIASVNAANTTIIMPDAATTITATYKDIPSSTCFTSSGSYQGQLFEVQSDTFEVTFDATPLGDVIDVVAGLSSSLATTHSDVACGIRFKLDGTIVARNGGAWSTSTINYIADTSYSFRLVVDVPSHTYSIYVTPQGGSELTIGTDYDFRTEQASISSLAYWNLSDVEGNGTATVCNFELNTFEDNCLTSSASYQSQSFEDQTDTFEATFDVTPLADGIDAVTGLSTIAATGHSDVACIVRFKYDNVIYARNGGTYESPSAISYTANTTYSFRMVIDIAAHTYSLYVTPEGGSELTVGEDFAFRTEQAGASSLAYLNIVDVDGVDETLEVCDLTVIPLGASCLTSSASYQSQSFDSQAGTFEATFDATPLADGIDAVTGLSTIAATGHSDVACIVRFKYDSIIYARNGSSYESPSAIPYTANTTYSFRMVVDIAAHTYSLYVTPEGGSELTVGEDFAFRTEQAGASSLAYLNIVDVDGVDGTLEVCNLVIDHNGSVRIDAPLGIALGKGNSSFMLFPNPARATLFLSLGEGPGSQGAIEVYTLQGIKIYQTSQKVSFPYKVDVSSYTPGIYIVKVELNGKYFTQKLVKE